jgi:hypothetical protein
MARSVKKNPVQKYAPVCGKIGKQFANRRVRRFNKDLSSGNAYKKLYETWDIHDCVDRTTLKTHLARWVKYGAVCKVRGWDEKSNFYGANYQEAVNKWKKSYIRK